MDAAPDPWREHEMIETRRVADILGGRYLPPLLGEVESTPELSSVDLSARIGLVNSETLYFAGDGDEIQLSVQEVSRAIIPSANILRRMLRIDPDSPVSTIEQVVSAGGTPVYFRVGYHPPTVDPEQLARRAAELHRSAASPIEHAFERLFGVPYGSTEVNIGAVRASQPVADRLGVEPESPVMLREVLVRAADGMPRSLSFSYYRSDRITVVDISPIGSA
jgi:hypothetical protein